MRTTLSVLAVILGLSLFSPGAIAKKGNLLENQPAVRHRHELRAKRFELGPSVNFSLNRFLRHAVLFGLKLEYHINDWLSIGADVGYGIGMDTGLNSELAGQYLQEPERWQELTRRMADIQLAGDARLVFTPMAGKMGIFSKIFIGYDFYGFAGFGFALTKNRGNPGEFGRVDPDNPNSPLAETDAANEGFRPGACWGFGMHLFFNKFISMGAEIKDIIFQDNEPGGDITRGLKENEQTVVGGKLINGDDKNFSNHFFVGINFTFFFPTKAEISF